MVSERKKVSLLVFDQNIESFGSEITLKVVRNTFLYWLFTHLTVQNL